MIVGIKIRAGYSRASDTDCYADYHAHRDPNRNAHRGTDCYADGYAYADAGPDVVCEAMDLKDVKYNYTGGHKGAGWKGDVKFMSLAVDKIISTGWMYKLNSRQTLEKAVREIISDLEES